MNSITLRSAIDTEAPTADLIWVVSAVSRDTNSPSARGIEEGGEARSDREHVAPEIGDDALADRHDGSSGDALAAASTRQPRS